MSIRSRHHVFGLSFAIAFAVGIMGGAFAIDDKSADRNPRTAAQVYDDSMTLEQIADLASGEPGEMAPPCPTAETVARLKKARIHFGPCDPNPERGMGVILPSAPDQEEAAEKENCPVVVGSKGYPGLKVSLPCAPGASILDAVPVSGDSGQTCLELTYRPSGGEKVVSERICPGEKASVGGTAVGADLQNPGEEQ